MRAKMLELGKQGFWVVLPLHVALTLPNLHLSPLGVVPECNCRPRLIVNFSYSSVNDETAGLAPCSEAMQFRKALQCIMSKLIQANPGYGPSWLLPDPSPLSQYPSTSGSHPRINGWRPDGGSPPWYYRWTGWRAHHMSQR